MTLLEIVEQHDSTWFTPPKTIMVNKCVNIRMCFDEKIMTVMTMNLPGVWPYSSNLVIYLKPIM